MKYNQLTRAFGKYKLIVSNLRVFSHTLLFTKQQNLSRLKAFADDKLDVAEMMISVSFQVENNVGKGENAGDQHFLLFSQCFQKASPLGLLKFCIVW